MKRALFISTSIPPATDMQTTRNMYLIRAMINNGFIVDVLTCGEYSRGSSSFDDILDKVTVFRTDYPNVLKWHKSAQKLLHGTPLLKVHNVLINYYAKPDLYVGWNKVAREYISSHNMYDYDVVITSSGGYSAHFVGEYIKKNKGIQWIAEYGDPWGLDGYGNINKKFYNDEQIMLQSCDGIVFTTQPTIEAYKKHYDVKIPYCLVPCGYDELVIDSDERNNKGSYVFTYTGVAYGKSRNLSNFLSVAGKKKDVEVQIVGSYSNSLKATFGDDSVRFLGRVSYADSLDIISKTDVLVHIGNFGTMQIPGKTYIYLSSQKPILYIQQQENNDPTLNVLKQFGGVVYCKNDMESINRATEYLISNYEKIKLEANKRANSQTLLNYRWDKLGERFSEFVKITMKS